MAKGENASGVLSSDLHTLYVAFVPTHTHPNKIEMWLGMVVYIFIPSTSDMVEGGTLSSRSTWPT